MMHNLTTACQQDFCEFINSHYCLDEYSLWLLPSAMVYNRLKLVFLPLFLFVATPAFAIITLGSSNQPFTLTGIGPNAQGQGQANVQWGSCAYDGTTTTCTLSGSYTGLGPGGTYAFVFSYTGNGQFPLIAVFPVGSNFFSFQATGNYTAFAINLTPNSGPPISFYSFANWQWLYNSPTCTPASISPCAAGTVAATPGAVITGAVSGTFDPTPSITPNGALVPDNYGSFTSISPASWMVMYGINLATVRSQVWDTYFQGTQAPSTLGGTSVTVAGLPAYVSYVSPGQVNVQIPSGVPPGLQQIIVTTAGGSSVAYPIRVVALEPAMLAPLSFIIKGNQYVVAQFSGTSTYVLPVPISGIGTTRARAGDSITIYGIGFGPVTPNISAGQIEQQLNQLQNSFTVTFGGVQAQVTYAGLVPSIVGIYQFNITVPSVPASDTVPFA